MRIQNIAALFIKQSKDVLKNLPVLVLFIVYPVVALVMTLAMKEQAGMDTFFVTLFATMHCAFTPVVATSSIIAEEKENNTLRVLIMSNVTLKEYLVSIGGFILISDLLSASTFLFMSNRTLASILSFLLSMCIGSLISIVLGSCIGLYTHNAAAANGLAVPFGLLFSFLPMLSSFNEGIERISRFTYGQQVSYLISGKSINAFGVVVILINLITLLALSTFLFKKSLFEE